MKRIGTLTLAALMTFAFGAVTFTSVSAHAKTITSDTAKKKKRKKSKKKHQASHSAKTSSHKNVASQGTKADRAPASAGYQRASAYMTKH